MVQCDAIPPGSVYYIYILGRYRTLKKCLYNLGNTWSGSDLGATKHMVPSSLIQAQQPLFRPQDSTHHRILRPDTVFEGIQRWFLRVARRMRVQR